MDSVEKPHRCYPDKNVYIPGEFTDPHHRHPSHTDLVLCIYDQHRNDHQPKGYPRSRDDFLASLPEDCRCSHADEEKHEVEEKHQGKEVKHQDKEEKHQDKEEKHQDKEEKHQYKEEKHVNRGEAIRQPTDVNIHQMASRKKGSSPYLAAAKNFVFAKKLHKENLEHKPLPDTITDAMYRKAQMMGGEPGLMLKDGNYATGVGWKGYPGYGATRCTKLKVYRPKTCVHTETTTKKRLSSISSFDKKWRFIRQQKVTPMELAIRWDMIPADPCDEPRPPVHIDGSNGSQAPAVFTLVHTARENIERMVEECNCPSNVQRPKTTDFRTHKEPRLCQSNMTRTKSAFNFHNFDKKPSQSSKPTVYDKKLHKSTPDLNRCCPCSCSCSNRNDLLPNARSCIACELRNVKSKPEKPKSEFKAAFKAGVPNNTRTTGKRCPEYPDHWRLASIYQQSYKPLHLRKRSFLTSAFH